MQDPSPYLQDLGIEMESALNTRLRAQVEDAYLSRVNYELYYFAEPREKRTFDEDPLDYCGVVTDPVTKQRFRPVSRSPRGQFAGRPWFFLSDSTQALFAAMPDSFLSPRYGMKPES